jgi:hypothetical protein
MQTRKKLLIKNRHWRCSYSKLAISELFSAGNQKAIFLSKSIRELEQDPASLKQAKNHRMLSVSKLATDLSVTQWWKTPNLKEDEETRKAVWTPTIAWQSLSGPTGTMETQPSSIQVSKYSEHDDLWNYRESRLNYKRWNLLTIILVSTIYFM